MMLVLFTQVAENYGTEDEPYWKMKGGSCIKVMNVPLGLSRDAIDDLARMVEVDSPFLTESVVDWSFQADDWLSWFEQSQLDYEGEIAYPEPVLQYEDLVNDLIGEAA